MPVFRRSSAGETDAETAGGEAGQAPEAPAKKKPAEQAGRGVTPKKDRPTPKRSQAESNRYRSIRGGTTSGRGGAPAPARRKRTSEEKARDSEQRRRERLRRTEAMRNGEDWALPPRDQGPLKKLARDYVDHRRRVSEYYMYGLIVLLIALFSHNAVIESYIGPLIIVLIVIIVVEGFFLSRGLRRLAAERFPGQSTGGLTWYSVMRMIQIRRFRNPLPRVNPGDKI